MINYITHLLPRTCPGPRLRAGRAKRWGLLAAALATLTGTGCYRATGIQRDAVVAETIPETGGDAVLGLKAKAGAGDLYLGNDFLQVAIDSTVYGDSTRTPLAGAASGGSIVDAGFMALDGSYNRVSIPSTVMNRFTPVVNQDPDLPVVFSSYQTSNGGGTSTITMTGAVLDTLGKLGTAGQLVPNVTVTETLSLAQLDHYILMTSVVTNNGSSSLAIRTVGDCLVQQAGGGGYHFNVPANYDVNGTPLVPLAGNVLSGVPNVTNTQWGVQIPGSSSPFTANNLDAVNASVQASMVGLMSNEPGADCVDDHASLGILPIDADQLLVAADSQDLLTVASGLRPSVPTHLAVGCLPVANLAAGASLTFDRRLYIVGGRSADTSVVGGQNPSAPYPDQTNGLFNTMDYDRYTDTTIPGRTVIQDTGLLTFTLDASSQRQGPLPTEVRIERNLNATLPGDSLTSANWQVQRVEWLEPNENLLSTTGLAPSTLTVRLPLGVYRMTLTSQSAQQVRTTFESNSYTEWVDLPSAIWIQKDRTFAVSAADVLCPDGLTDTGVPNQVGAVTVTPYQVHYFTTRENNATVGSLQPMRMTFVGTGTTSNPVMRRMRTLASYWDPNTNLPQVATGNIAGQYQFRANNEIFGTGFTKLLPSTFAWLSNNADYTVYASRGPLEPLLSMPVQVYVGQTSTSHVFTVTNMGVPAGWNSFDLPGASQATTGGALPGELFASAMANGIQVVGSAEQDKQVNALNLYNDFIAEFGSTTISSYNRPASLSYVNRPTTCPYGLEPFVVGGRSSTLSGYGAVTALFTPTATNAPLGGALDSTGWTLSDFISQAQGNYTIVRRPHAPSAGLFELKSAPIVNGAFAGWWSGTGSLTFGGATNGSFDAIELLRGESLPEQQFPSSGVYTSDYVGLLNQWYLEFQETRADWFYLLNFQSPSFFTKALGLSAASNTVDTPVGLARTYLKAVPSIETDLSSVLSALQSGAAVASTGPFLDVSIAGVGPGGTVPGPVANVTLTVNLYKQSWVPVDELRVIVNGSTALTFSQPITSGKLVATGTDTRLYSGTFTVPMPTSTGTDAWVVVEAGVPLTTTATTTSVYGTGTTWNQIMRGIYPIAVTNPIFVSVTGNATFLPSKGYVAPVTALPSLP
jgi:hypothetical protein